MGQTTGERVRGFVASPPPAHRVASVPRVEWLDPVKALALIAILLNHLVEEFGPGPWFTNPENAWPALAVRMHTFFPDGASMPLRLVRMLGWLGDAAPGVFILASGVGLTLSALKNPESALGARAFYRRRLLRLFPLYIAIHFVVLAGALFVPGNGDTFAGLRTFLSLTGVRALPGTFFHISPSWWFVWLILQLYVVYPYLFRALRKLGPQNFFLAALAVTIAARGFGLALPRGRYAWLTGLFFASRLAEFAAGMVLAQLMVVRRARGVSAAAPSTLSIAAGSLALYVFGLAASFTLPGALVSNLLVTLGMTGVFYAVWHVALRPVPALEFSASWLGRRSYAVFLLHQPPLQWTASWFGANRVKHLVAALVAIVLSVPVAAALEDWTARAMRWRPTMLALHARRALAFAMAIAIVVLAVGIIGAREPTDDIAREAAWLCAFALFSLALLFWFTRRGMELPERLLALTALVGGALELFVGPGTSGGFALGVGVAAALVIELLGAKRLLFPVRLVATAAAVLVCAIAGEVVLREVAPLETAVWGELPALETHPTRTFALIPNRTTHLRYNDYDYTVTTNSFGLASPEFTPVRETANAFRIFVAGDAFSMPEGLDFPQSYPAMLDERLSRCLAPRDVQVIDGGVTGYGPNEERVQIAELAPKFRPDVIVDQFYVNEFSDVSITPAAFRESIGLDLGSRGALRRLRDRSQLKTRVGRMTRTAKEQLTGHPAAWRYDLAQLDYYRTGANPLYDAATLARIATALAGMKRSADSSGARLIIAFVPASVAVSTPEQQPHFPRGENIGDAASYDLGRPYRALRQITDSLGIATVDLTPQLRAASATQATYFPASWHFTTAGHQAVAGAITRTLDTLGLLGAHCT